MSERTHAHRQKARTKHNKIRTDKRKPDEGKEKLMHEIKAVQKILEDLMDIEPKPEKIKVRLGRMNADPVVFAQMFREFVTSSGMPSIDIEVEPVPVKAKCRCGFEGDVPVIEHIHFVRCPKCNKVADIEQGNELEIVE